jgi:hypothetical protein
VFDLKTSADSQLPASGVEYMCMHYDASSKRLGALTVAAPDAGGGFVAGLTLVEIDVVTGATSTRLQLPPLPPGLTILRGGVVDTRFSTASPVSCSFSATGGVLSLLLVRVDVGAQPTDALQELHLMTVTKPTLCSCVPLCLGYPTPVSSGTHNQCCVATYGLMDCLQVDVREPRFVGTSLVDLAPVLGDPPTSKMTWRFDLASHLLAAFSA